MKQNKLGLKVTDLGLLWKHFTVFAPLKWFEEDIDEKKNYFGFVE